MNTKRGVALTTPLTAPFKTVTSLILFLKNNRRPARADGYFFWLLFKTPKILKLIVYIKEPKPIINPNAVSTGKRLLLSVRFWKYAHTHHLTFNRIATVTNFTVLIIISISKID